MKLPKDIKDTRIRLGENSYEENQQKNEEDNNVDEDDTDSFITINTSDEETEKSESSDSGIASFGALSTSFTFGINPMFSESNC